MNPKLPVTGDNDEQETPPTCPHCELPDLEDWQHRGCRMKAAFPDAYERGPNGLLVFDMAKIAERLERKLP